MKLANLLTPERIILEMKAGQHWPAIVELIDHLITVGALAAELRKEVLESLKTREEQVSTGVGYGVAIPHAFSDKLNKVITVLGRSREGIDFQSLDGKPVHFVILFLVPKKEYHMHLQALAAIAKMFTNIEIRRRLVSAACHEEILDIFMGRQTKDLSANGAC
jgi:mannitol/fructose-specific phosphotransferase system IIA component (Ntr-type)